MENNLGNDAGEVRLHTIFTSADKSRARLGWVSASTGLTYCGICLRAEVNAVPGTACHVCGARVAQVFEPSTDPASARRAWRAAFSLNRRQEPGCSGS